MERFINITPYNELLAGDKSIYDYIDEDRNIPDFKVIKYLQTERPYMMSPGVYNHPFKEETRLLGPYLYCDDEYCWDRDTWKYVLKYGLILPKEFIEKVMSDKGTAYLASHLDHPTSWRAKIGNNEFIKKGISLLPDNLGDLELSDF